MYFGLRSQMILNPILYCSTSHYYNNVSSIINIIILPNPKDTQAKTPPDQKHNSDQTYSYPRDWRLRHHWGPAKGTLKPPVHRVEGFKRGPLIGPLGKLYIRFFSDVFPPWKHLAWEGGRVHSLQILFRKKKYACNVAIIERANTSFFHRLAKRKYLPKCLVRILMWAFFH